MSQAVIDCLLAALRSAGHRRRHGDREARRRDGAERARDRGRGALIALLRRVAPKILLIGLAILIASILWNLLVPC
jgi:hypothetical protein